MMFKRKKVDPELHQMSRRLIDLLRENRDLYRRLASQEKHNIESRRSICEQSDRYKAERDEFEKNAVTANEILKHLALVLGVEWRQPDADHPVEWIDSTEVTRAALDLTAEVDRLQNKLAMPKEPE